MTPKPERAAKMRLPMNDSKMRLPMNDSKMRLLMNNSVAQKMLEVNRQIVHAVHCTAAAKQCTVPCICVRHVIRTESTARATIRNNTE